MIPSQAGFEITPLVWIGQKIGRKIKKVPNGLGKKGLFLRRHRLIFM